MKWMAIILSFLMASASLALTPQERDLVIKARTYVQKAKKDSLAQQKQLEDTDRQNEILDQMSQGQEKEIETLSNEIEKSHKNEQELAKYNAYAKPIIDRVNKYWGIGAILFGFGLLAKHLFILALVLLGIAAIVFVLSLFFPAIGVFLRTSSAFLVAFMRRIGEIFRKK